jgi:hypothetical protein
VALARHDYWCAVCGTLTPDVYVPIAVGARAGAPLHCGQTMAWIPGTTAMDIGGVKTAGFKAFDTTDGRGNPVRVDSLHKLRQVEREAEQAYRNGEGQPMIFRRWAQDGSNRDQHTLHPSYDGGERPDPAAAHRFGETLRKSAEEPDHAFGPAVNESNASALPMSGKE